MPPAVTCRGIRHTFGQGVLAEPVLRGIDLALERGECCMLMGPSGSGKTTLLSILGCLLTPSDGEIHIAGRRVDSNNPATLTHFRRKHIGFVFQQSQLLPFLTVDENLAVVGRNAGLPHMESRRRIADLLNRLEVGACRGKKPAQLSGGQRQRIAVARALLHRPPIVLADEPTAALDWQHGESAVRLLREEAHAAGAALLVVTHDARLRPHFDRCLVIDSGRVHEEVRP